MKTPAQCLPVSRRRRTVTGRLGTIVATAHTDQIRLKKSEAAPSTNSTTLMSCSVGFVNRSCRYRSVPGLPRR